MTARIVNTQTTQEPPQGITSTAFDKILSIPVRQRNRGEKGSGFDLMTISKIEGVITTSPSHGAPKENENGSPVSRQVSKQVRSWLLREKDQLTSMTLDAEEFIPAGAGRAGQICRSGYRGVTRRLR
jgi:hypothetical protein